MLEVLLATMIVTLVFGFLLGVVSSFLSRLSASQDEAAAALLALERIRALEAQVSNPEEPIPEGISEGVFDEPNSHLAWQIRVEPWQLPLPASYEGDSSPSLLFAAPDGAASGGEDESVLHRIEIRVYPDGEDPERGAENFVTFAVTPSDALGPASGVMRQAETRLKAQYLDRGGKLGPRGSILCNGHPARNGLERWMAANGDC